MKLTYEAITLAREASKRGLPVMCFDRRIGSFRHPEEFLILSNGKVAAVFPGEPPRNVSFISDRTIRISEDIDISNEDPFIRIKNLGRTPEVEDHRFNALMSSDVENLFGCPRCKGNRIIATVAEEQTLEIKLDPDTGMKAKEGSGRELGVIVIICRDCGFMIMDKEEGVNNLLRRLRR